MLCIFERSSSTPDFPGFPSIGMVQVLMHIIYFLLSPAITSRGARLAQRAALLYKQQQRFRKCNEVSQQFAAFNLCTLCLFQLFFVHLSPSTPRSIVRFKQGNVSQVPLALTLFSSSQFESFHRKTCTLADIFARTQI
ncbi:hypothetical protein C8J55DRAFT_183393 [Lentinula edodes]|uniref:Uncharacterized protein n=1 Tax=Lentinula lateritia TaxID=40482 RepID=A0A9W9A019_9AGAR|nr:hypothetical protein C8J55DRAFT_183393 [Lentinula edodes]